MIILFAQASAKNNNKINSKININRKHPQKKNSFYKSNYLQPSPVTISNSNNYYDSSSNNNYAQSPPSKNHHNNIVNIIAFGDSLTEGMHRSEYGGFAPYTTTLEDLLNNNDQTKQYQVINDGISGECVFMEMASRLPISIQENAQNLKLVIILGGTNDLLTLDCDNNVNLTKEIINLHTIAHSRGYRTIMMTIPEANVANDNQVLTTTSYETFHRLWWNTNQALRQYAVANKGSTTLCDLARKFPMHSLNEQHKAYYWSDDLHPTPKGYEKMAYLLYEIISKINL